MDGDDDLDALRQKRMAEMQAKRQQQEAKEEQKQMQDEQKRIMLTQLLTGDARERRMPMQCCHCAAVREREREQGSLRETQSESVCL